MRPVSIIDVLEILCVIDAVGFTSLFVLVGLLFRQHDRDLRAEVVRLRALIDQRLK